MHEFGVAQGVLDAVLARAAEHNAERIVCVRMAIGVLAGVEESSLLFAFNALAEGTVAENAELVIEKIPLRCYCGRCELVFECRPLAYRCPQCREASHDIRTGREMNLVAMEVS